MNTKFTDKQKQDAYNLRELYMKHGYNQAEKNEPLHIKACMLYWAEGSKSSRSLYFVNCDPNTHLIMLNFIKTYFPNHEKKLRGLISFYPSKEIIYDDVLQYWSKITSIPLTQFTKPIDRSKYYKSPKVNKFPNGIFRLSISSVEILYHIYGSINFYVGKSIFNPFTGR